MNFLSRLRNHPVVLEAIPPRTGATAAQIDRALETLEAVLRDCQADAINVPEILGSGFQSMDPLEYGLHVRKRFGTDVIVNKVVVHEPRSAFEAWMDRLLASEIVSTVLVGGERGGIYYPGPSVLEANRLARARAESAGRSDFAVGNVTLPSRPSEAARMMAKVAAGCNFFTSQIVYESPTANAHLQAYEDVCALGNLPPRPVLYAFSPVEGRQDVTFLRYLGVHVPPDVERALLAATSNDPNPSLRIIQEIWTSLLRAARDREIAVPLGVIVEMVSRHNAASTAALVRTLRASLDGATVAPPSAVGLRP